MDTASSLLADNAALFLLPRILALWLLLQLSSLPVLLLSPLLLHMPLSPPLTRNLQPDADAP